jgi:hypothetical protein
MPTVYQGHGIVITDDVFAVCGPEPRMYDLEGLGDLHVERDGRPARLGLFAVGARAAEGAEGAEGTERATITLARVLAPWCLRAGYAGAVITLFESTNVISVLRVQRGLMRAFAANAASVERLYRAGCAEAYGRLNALL